ncbi:DUF3429 domain-containing protein [Rhizobium sp. SSA_523]|uniref:DUF3429 domain-containing protein n=1 Tax=Rhizobium sp. SSA_523 TaxID=2952477 RepID=UPI002090F257|nr:DUF3429 domain-containing protein [Rhizobium sp. SSA_523]MCO5732128.1 DUF3429 domain-containing protein [Rhizobium sp. SSA_523]WKC25627.1 DUF3429 domain-containing protein [Rhizobium sp. SSA_523]
MILPSRTLTQILTYAGALPFFLLLPPTFPLLAVLDPLKAFLAYGAVIAAFMGGSLWGLVQAREASPILPLLLSNLLALCAWLSLLVEEGRAALLLQLAIFLALLGCDRLLLAAGLEQRWYWRLRLRITGLVCLAYLAKLMLT